MNNISKHFTDDEIIGRLPNGDLYIKQGVKKLSTYKAFTSDITVDEHINYDAFIKSYNEEVMKRYTDFKPYEDEIDDWSTK